MRRDTIIRALGLRDGSAVQAFVRGLSPRSRRERYFSPIVELTPRELERATRSEMSFAAFHGTVIVAMAECARGEIGIVVADAWQGRGLGRELLQRLSAHAARSGIPALHGFVRKGNRAMLRLAAGFGFRAARDADPELVHIKLALAPT